MRSRWKDPPLCYGRSNRRTALSRPDYWLGFLAGFLDDHGPGTVPLPDPLAQLPEQLMQFQALPGQRILDPGRSLRVDLPLDDLPLLQLMKPLSQARGANTMDTPFQLVEPSRLFQPESMYHGQCPSLGEAVPCRMEQHALFSLLSCEVLVLLD